MLKFLDPGVRRDDDYKDHQTFLELMVLRTFDIQPARPFRLVLVLLILVLTACGDRDREPATQTDATLRSLNAGYGILHTTLRDEQHLKTVRLTKAIITFESVSEPTRKIIDDIARTSSSALDKLEELAALSPELTLDTGDDEQIEQMTRDALRITTAKELLTSKDDFEIVLLVSQAQVLRFLSHLTDELHAVETNILRRDWLGRLSKQLEALYLRVMSRLTVA